MKKLPFVKMHGLGNDFVVIDGIGDTVSVRSWRERSIELCDRPRGVGSDGVILALPSRSDRSRCVCGVRGGRLLGMAGVVGQREDLRPSRPVA